MKNSSKLLAAIAAGSVLGVLFAPAKGSETRKKIDTQARKLKKLLRGRECSKAQLTMVKEKLEKHKERLEKHLQKINSRLVEYDTKTSSESN